MNKFNKAFAAIVAAIVAGLSGENAWLVPLLPDYMQAVALGAVPILVALVPNGKPFWMIGPSS